jgi:hypothetical protein
MDTTTVTRTAARQTGAALVTAYNLDTELTALYAAQDLWLKEQAALGDAISVIEDHGFRVRPRFAWCWADSPHAARIAEIEASLGV